MDAARVMILRELLASTGWVERTRRFARALRTSTGNRGSGGLLLVGTPTEDPWHLAAHLEDESRYAGLPGLSPTLVRWSPPPGAPVHLATGLERLAGTRRGETVFVVAPDAAPERLLERVDDARRVGATILTLETGDTELRSLAHESLTVPETGLILPDSVRSRVASAQPGGVEFDEYGMASPLAVPDLSVPAVSFEAVQHLVSTAAGENVPDATGRGRTFRDRLSRLPDIVSGPAPER